MRARVKPARQPCVQRHLNLTAAERKTGWRPFRLAWLCGSVDPIPLLHSRNRTR